MDQRTQFIHSEGDAFFRRNQVALTQGELAARDPVLRLLEGWGHPPAKVLEVGCANGWRLQQLVNRGAGSGFGIDPSPAAISEGKAAHPGLQLQVGTAESLPFADGSMDMVVFGFCLYLCDPADHFRIVAEADRVLADHGSLLVFDFDPPTPYRNAYAHQKAIFSYKFKFEQLFLAHPHYQLLSKTASAHGGGRATNPDEQVAVSWLIKETATAWPANPWAPRNP